MSTAVAQMHCPAQETGCDHTPLRKTALSVLTPGNLPGSLGSSCTGPECDSNMALVFPRNIQGHNGGDSECQASRNAHTFKVKALGGKHVFRHLGHLSKKLRDIFLTSMCSPVHIAKEKTDQLCHPHLRLPFQHEVENKIRNPSFFFFPCHFRHNFCCYYYSVLIFFKTWSHWLTCPRRPGWPQTHGHLPYSAFPVLELEACSIISILKHKLYPLRCVCG